MATNETLLQPVNAGPSMSERLTGDIIPSSVREEMATWANHDQEGSLLRRNISYLINSFTALEAQVVLFGWNVPVSEVLAMYDKRKEELPYNDAILIIDDIVAEFAQTDEFTKQLLTSVLYDTTVLSGDFGELLTKSISVALGDPADGSKSVGKGFRLLELTDRIDFSDLTSIELDFMWRRLRGCLGEIRTEELANFRALPHKDQSQEVRSQYRKLGLAFLLPPTEEAKQVDRMRFTSSQVAKSAKSADGFFVTPDGRRQWQRDIAAALDVHPDQEALEILAGLDQETWTHLFGSYFPSYNNGRGEFAVPKYTGNIDTQVTSVFDRERDPESPNPIINTYMNTGCEVTPRYYPQNPMGKARPVYGHSTVNEMLRMIRVTEAVYKATGEELYEVLKRVVDRVAQMQQAGIKYFSPHTAEGHVIDYAKFHEIQPNDSERCRQALVNMFSRRFGHYIFTRIEGS